MTFQAQVLQLLADILAELRAMRADRQGGYTSASATYGKPRS